MKEKGGRRGSCPIQNILLQILEKIVKSFRNITPYSGGRLKNFHKFADNGRGRLPLERERTVAGAQVAPIAFLTRDPFLFDTTVPFERNNAGIMIQLSNDYLARLGSTGK